MRPEMDVASDEKVDHGGSDLGRELGELVEEEDAQVRERGLAGPWMATSPEHAGKASGRVRAPKRAFTDGTLEVLGHKGMDLGDDEGFIVAKWCEEAWEPTCEHGRAAPGRADEENIVAAGSGDLESSLGAVMSSHLREVEVGGG